MNPRLCLVLSYEVPGFPSPTINQFGVPFISGSLTVREGYLALTHVRASAGPQPKLLAFLLAALGFAFRLGFAFFTLDDRLSTFNDLRLELDFLNDDDRSDDVLRIFTQFDAFSDL